MITTYKAKASAVAEAFALYATCEGREGNPYAERSGPTAGRRAPAYSAGGYPRRFRSGTPLKAPEAEKAEALENTGFLC